MIDGPGGTAAFAFARWCRSVIPEGMDSPAFARTPKNVTTMVLRVGTTMFGATSVVVNPAGWLPLAEPLPAIGFRFPPMSTAL